MTSQLEKNLECFYNKEGKWYYAGSYSTFRLDYLAPPEWEMLSNEASQSIIKETLAGRKNTTPQNNYETGQLYSVGALRVACIGLQCVGFNDALYRGLLAQVEACAKSGRWRSTTSTGLGVAGGAWNIAANSNVNSAAGAVGVAGPVTILKAGEGLRDGNIGGEGGGAKMI